MSYSTEKVKKLVDGGMSTLDAVKQVFTDHSPYECLLLSKCIEHEQEIGRLREALKKENEVSRERFKENRKLRNAIMPFAALLQPYHATKDSETPVYQINDNQITVGDLRRAKKALDQ